MQGCLRLPAPLLWHTTLHWGWQHVCIDTKGHRLQCHLLCNRAASRCAPVRKAALGVPPPVLKPTGLQAGCLRIGTICVLVQMAVLRLPPVASTQRLSHPCCYVLDCSQVARTCAWAQKAFAPAHRAALGPTVPVLSAQGCIGAVPTCDPLHRTTLGPQRPVLWAIAVRHIGFLNNPGQIVVPGAPKNVALRRILGGIRET